MNLHEGISPAQLHRPLDQTVSPLGRLLAHCQESPEDSIDVALANDFLARHNYDWGLRLRSLGRDITKVVGIRTEPVSPDIQKDLDLTTWRTDRRVFGVRDHRPGFVANYPMLGSDLLALFDLEQAISRIDIPVLEVESVPMPQMPKGIRVPLKPFYVTEHQAPIAKRIVLPTQRIADEVSSTPNAVKTCIQTMKRKSGGENDKMMANLLKGNHVDRRYLPHTRVLERLDSVQRDFVVGRCFDSRYEGTMWSQIHDTLNTKTKYAVFVMMAQVGWVDLDEIIAR